MERPYCSFACEDMVHQFEKHCKQVKVKLKNLSGKAAELFAQHDKRKRNSDSCLLYARVQREQGFNEVSSQ
ncbi:hypothetical protein [Okeania sp. KiyG1]|uniref:hypothetical protein n=1 Tax=Okeania sp. KiyG1 TaxID=2720165 RepID=UPI0019244F74|nr:hypothetical protein [Okeania sp. KiyG1]